MKCCEMKNTHPVLIRKRLALPSNIRLGCKGFPGTHSVAYLQGGSVTWEKRFMTLTPGPNVTKLFQSVIYEFL
jgi:hypothetical protein